MKKNQKKVLILVGVILMLVLAIGLIVYATNKNGYMLEIIDDGSTQLATDSTGNYSSINKKIVEDNDENFVYEVTLKNLQEKIVPIEVAVLIDSSKSMQVNDEQVQVKAKAIEFIENLYTTTSGAEISVSSNSGVEYGRTSLNSENVKNGAANAVNNIVEGKGSNLNDGITYATSTFSTNQTEKYLIIFSDATDSTVTSLENVKSTGIKTYAILTDMTNSEFETTQDLVNGIKMITDVDFSSIYYDINKSLKNVKVTDVFSDEVNEYFNFEQVLLDEEHTLNKTDTGYEWIIPELQSQGTATLKFKLTLRDDVPINSQKIYTKLSTSKQMVVEYNDETNIAKTYKLEESPTFRICQEYSFTVKAVSEKSDKLPVTDLQFKVVGTIVTGQDENGNDLTKTVYENTLTTDANGEIQITGLKATGTINYELKPIVNQVGYDETSSTLVKVTNDPQGAGIYAEADNLTVNVEPTKRNISVTIPINVQGYNINIETKDVNNENVKLGNIEYRLIQPKLNSKYEMEALYGTTDANGKLTFRPTVMTKAGNYEYILSQTNDLDGYDSMGNVTLIVTFNDNGEVTKVQKKFNDNVNATLVNSAEIKVDIGNQAQKDDTFKLEINVVDEDNQNIKLEGAVYDVELTRVSSGGEQITTSINGNITNSEGKIALELPGNGNIRVKITEVSPKPGYTAVTQTKEITFVRNNGTVQYISAKTPLDIDAVADSDANALVVNFTSKLKTEQNRVRLHVVDNDERDINVPNMLVQLQKVGTTQTYTAITNADGIADFIIADEVAGAHPYELKLLSAVPNGYILTSTSLGSISIAFDDNRNIYEVSDIEHGDLAYYSTHYEAVAEEQFLYHTAFVDIGLTPDAANTYTFQVKVVDKDNMAQTVEGAKYDITIESGDIVRTIKGRATDSNGMLTTRLVGGDNVTIRVKQAATIKGYAINTQEQIIELTKIADAYQITSQEPYVYSPSEGVYIGAEIVGKNIIYHDVNKKKSGDDTILNLYVNKKDTDDNLVGAVKTVITSPTLLYPNDTALEINSIETDENGYFEIPGIHVQGNELVNGERIDYLYMYEIDVNGEKKPNTDITFKLIFRYNENKEIVEITNVEATWGNRLVAKREFSGYETEVAYESNVYLDIYTNYDDLGNFSLDLNKINKDKVQLPGATYDVTVTRLDGTRLIRKDLPITSQVEFSGFFVAVGTKIEITEKQAPIGYDINAYTEILTVTEIDPLTGDVTVELEGSGYETPRAEIANKETLVLSDGTYKTCITLDLIDYELDTFKFGILAQDSKTKLPITGYKFTISSDQGAQANTNATDDKGRVSTLVGANYEIENYVVTYKIDTLKATDFYKKLSKPIEVKVVFDLNGEVIGSLTEQANSTLEGYGTIWSIEATNTIDGNDIDIILNIETEDPLIVNTQFVDTITGAVLDNVEGQITPSLNIPGTGSTRVEVGYVLPNGIQTYTLKQTNLIDNYVQLTDKQFKITYDANGDIQIAESLTEGLTVVSFAGKEITIKVDMEPGVPFAITNTGYFDGLNLLNGKFEITSAQNITKIASTDANGIGIGYVDKFGNNETVRYTIKQTAAASGYATVDEFQVDVTFDENRNITNVVLVGEVNKYVEFVTVGYKTPSVSSDAGYNNNDKGIVQISVKNYPEVQFNIENVDRQDESIKLPGTVYEVTSSINTKDPEVTTNEEGVGIAHMDRSGYGTTVTYTINELSPSVRYQSLAIEAVIEVDFDNEGFITATRVVKRDDVTKAELPVQVENIDKFKVNIQIKSNPELAIAINKVDKDSNEPVAKVDFEITARITKDNLLNYSEEDIEKLTLNTSEITEEEYLSQVLDRLKVDPEDVETMKENLGLAKLINTLKENDNLTTEEEDEINSAVNNSEKINKIIDLGKATKTQINEIISSITYKEVVDSLIEKGTTTQDRVNELLETLKNLVRLDVDNVTTDVQGQATAYMDKTLANKTIEYTIKETRKADGYDWLDEVVIIEVTYDSTGKIIENDGVKLVSGDINITNVDIDNFAINVKINNKPSDEVRIHLTVEDVYDSNKKLETAEFDAFLVDSSKGMGFLPDDKYRVSLASGSVTSSTGNVTAHGEDTESIGIYEEGTGNRILRLVQKQTPDTYFIGNNEYKSGYQSIGYALLVNVSFDDEGKITGVTLYSPGGDTNQIGYAADERYIQVSHTRNTINVTVRYYPMLQVQMQTVDMYTGASLEASYGISTTQWGYSVGQQHAVKSGHINPYYNSSYAYFGSPYEASYTTNGELDNINNAERVKIAPTEADNNNRNTDERERILYIYETEEPTSPIQYQTYSPRYITHSYQKLLAIIKVNYDELGQIDKVEVLETVSNNNITENFFTLVEASVNEHTIQITVKYAPITTITATVVDEITGVGLGGIRINPYVNTDYSTNQSYEYRTINYYTTGASGVTGWTYWGASVNDSLNRYELDSYTVGSGYDGYLDPGNIILDVAYDGNGRVAAVTPRSTDEFGDINAVNITWENNDIKVTIPYSRSFNVKLNKVDFYDSNTILNAGFKVISTENANVNVAANSNTTIGKVYAGKTVKYTLSETAVPSGYIPINNLEIFVTFNNDGTVRSATSTSEYYQFVKAAEADTNINRVNKVDLEANIKNKPRFDVNIELTDKFYPSLALEGGLFSIENSKGDVSEGGIATDENGILETFVGPIYPGEEVTYTVKQTNTINGYYESTEIIKFKVLFNESGKIESYSLISGEGAVSIDPAKFVNTKGITMQVTNKPKDIKVGIYKYDELTQEPMSNIKFNVTTEIVGGANSEETIITNEDGTVVTVADTFVERSEYRVVKYTISEIEVPNSYRKIQDVVVQVTYNKDGSMYLYDVLSNESNVNVEVATNKQIRFIGEMPVHIKLSIPNDNAYDLIIKNEDKNYEGLGIEGTKYDVTINGIAQEVITTNKEGVAKIPKQTQVGDITIRIAEREIGEGYRADNKNDTTLQVHKGEEVYSLALNSNSNPDYADVVVDEEHGTITVTFRNETKLELNLVKDDINTGEVLEGAVFEITEQEIDEYGNAIEGTQNTITTDANNTTNAEGVLYFDLGLSKQNKIIEYTLTEVTAPTGYTEILPIKVKVTFDMYGRIVNIEDDSFRAECYLDSDTGKSHNMIFNVSNGTVNPEYTVKVISEDSQTKNRITGSLFQVEVFDEEETTIKSVTGASRDVTKTIGNKAYVSERGVMKVTGITTENNVKIAVNQIETLTGYAYGSNVTHGNVTINAKFEVSETELEKELKLSVVDDGGFEVTVDNTNREVIIKVKNDPVLTFDITKVDQDTKQVIEGAKFRVKSVIQTNATTTDTDLNEEAKLTDSNGHTTLNGGIIYAGKTMIYTLTEDKMDGYEQLEDIVILVQYDTKGNIYYYEVLSDVDDVDLLDGVIETSKRVLGETDMPGIVEIEYQDISIPTGVGTRILQLTVKNKESIIDKDYQIVIEKHHELDPAYPYFIPGVTFEIKVTQEYGKKTTEWTDITNEEGIITSPNFSGYGYITIELKEIAGSDGYKLDYATKTIKLYRNERTKKLNIVSADVGYEFSDDNTKIILKPVNEVASGVYSIILNKVDKDNNVLISNNPAEFEVTMVEQYETNKEVVNEQTGEVTYEKETTEIKNILATETTDEKGRLVLDNLKTPQSEGTYRYVIKETKAPEGYVALLEDLNLDVTFAKNASDEMVIVKAEVVSGENITIARQSEQLLNIIIGNENKANVVDENKYAIDVTKVDETGNAITTDTAVFKLTDKQTGDITYLETNEYGKLPLQSFDIPKEVGTYEYVLNEIKAPEGYALERNDITITVEFVENSEGIIILNSVDVQGENINYELPAEGELPNPKIQIDVINKVGSNGNANDKPYTLILNKLDSITKELITARATFEVSLVNGEIVHAATNTEGQIIIENVYMPVSPGEYEIVVKELTAPEGYILDSEMKIVKVTFEGTNQDMIISNIALGDTNNSNIEIAEDECTETQIVLDVLNGKVQNEDLYVYSKEDENGTDIYNVLSSFEGRHYTIEKPFIDTKVAKYGSNMTVQEFIDNLDSNGELTVWDNSGNQISSSSRVKTGMTLKATKGTQELTFTIVVKGDADGDGRVRTKDLDMLVKHLSGENTITDAIALRALDIKEEGGDGKIRTTDLNEFYNVMARG